MDGTASKGCWRTISGKGHRISRRDGGSRSLWKTVPSMRNPRAAYRSRRTSGQLLSTLPDGRKAPCRSSAFEAAEGGLAEDIGRAKPDHGPANHLRQGYGGPPKLYAKAEAGHYLIRIATPSDGPIASMSGFRSGPFKLAFEIWISSSVAISCTRGLSDTTTPPPPSAR